MKHRQHKVGPAQTGTSGPESTATTVILPLSLLHNPHDERDLQDEILETRKKLYEIGKMYKQSRTQSPPVLFICNQG